MRDPKSLITTEQLAAALGQPDLRIYDCTTYLEPTPPGSDDPYIAVPGRKTFEEGACSGRRLPRPAGRVLRRGHAAALHDAGDRAARGGLRPSRFGRGRSRRALQHRLHDVGDALLVDAQIARLRRRGGARRRLRQVEGGRAAHGERPRPGLPAGRVQGPAATGPVRRQARGAGRDPGAEHRDRQCARPPVPQGPRAQPVRPPGARPGQRQCPGGDARRSGAEGLHHAGRRRRRSSGRRASRRTSA